MATPPSPTYNLSRRGNTLEEKPVFAILSFGFNPLHPPPPLQHLPYLLSLSSLCGAGTDCLCTLI